MSARNRGGRGEVSALPTLHNNGLVVPRKNGKRDRMPDFCRHLLPCQKGNKDREIFSRLLNPIATASARQDSHQHKVFRTHQILRARTPCIPGRSFAPWGIEPRPLRAQGHAQNIEQIGD